MKEAEKGMEEVEGGVKIEGVIEDVMGRWRK